MRISCVSEGFIRGPMSKDSSFVSVTVDNRPWVHNTNDPDQLVRPLAKIKVRP